MAVNYVQKQSVKSEFLKLTQNQNGIRTSNWKMIRIGNDMVKSRHKFVFSIDDASVAQIRKHNCPLSGRNHETDTTNAGENEGMTGKVT